MTSTFARTADRDAPSPSVRLDLPGLRRELEAQAHLFDDPRTYLAGVADALTSVQRDLESQLAARAPVRRSVVAV